MKDFESRRTADRALELLVAVFLAFVGGTFFGYLWMAKAYGILD